MNKVLCVILLLIVPALSVKADEAPDVVGLSVQYLNELSSGNYEKSLEIAYELNAIDPSDTQALLYIVLSSLKAGKQIPPWIFDEPWPNAEAEDKFNKQLAERLANGT